MKKLQESDLYELRFNQKLSLQKIADNLGSEISVVCKNLRKYSWYVPRSSYKKVELTDRQCERTFGDGKRCTRKIKKGFRKLCQICYEHAEGDIFI